MVDFPLSIKTERRGKTITIRMDAKRFERLAATFNFFSKEFLDSIERAERDVRAGRVRRIKSLKDLRK